MVEKKQIDILYKWILESIEQIEEYINGMWENDFFESKLVIDGCLMQLQHIWETVIQISKIDNDFNIFEKERIIWFRNLVSHQYRAIRTGFIRNILNEKLPLLKKEILEKLNPVQTNNDYNIKLLNHKWEEEWFFSVTQDQIDRYSILELAENNWLNIWYSCRSGACVACSCKVVSGIDHIDIWKIEIPLIDADKGDILTCCAGLKSTKSQIIIQKKY